VRRKKNREAPMRLTGENCDLRFVRVHFIAFYSRRLIMLFKRESDPHVFRPSYARDLWGAVSNKGISRLTCYFEFRDDISGFRVRVSGIPRGNPISQRRSRAISLPRSTNPRIVSLVKSSIDASTRMLMKFNYCVKRAVFQRNILAVWS